MVSLLALTALASLQQGSIPIQFIPKAQLKFERKDTILESNANESLAMVLVNDEDVSNEVLDAVTKNSDSVRLVEVARKEATGNLIFWSPSGRLINETNIVIPAADVAKMDPGEVAIVLVTSQGTGFPKSATDKPTINCSIAAGKNGRTILGANKLPYTFLRIGVPKFKFSNVRLSIRVSSYAGTLSITPGTAKTIHDIDLKVVGKTTVEDPKFEHFEVVESGFQGMDNLAMIAQFDWTTYEKEVAPVRNHNEAVYGRLVRKQGEPVDYKDMHFDFPSAKPVKYFSEITILRSSAIQGYFQHVPTEPVGT